MDEPPDKPRKFVLPETPRQRGQRRSTERLGVVIGIGFGGVMIWRAITALCHDGFDAEVVWGPRVLPTWWPLDVLGGLFLIFGGLLLLRDVLRGK